MLLASLPIDRQRQYDLFLAFVPVALLGTLAASWVFPVPFRAAALIGLSAIGIVLIAVVLGRPPTEF